MHDVIAQFRDAMAARGIQPPDELIADGQLHRCDVEGKRGKSDAAYVLHLDGPVPVGGFENWRDGRGWQRWRPNLSRRLSQTELISYRAHLQHMRQQRLAVRAQGFEAARHKAEAIFQKTTACIAHPYLSRKGVPAYGLRQYGEALVVPMQGNDDVLHSLQFIAPDGQKKFLSGGRKQGCYYLIGEPADVLCIAEGFATAASLHTASGHAVAVAFDAGNLLSVAKALRARFPHVRLLICGDDDAQTEGNPGRTKAEEAAQAVRAAMVLPEFTIPRPERATDFNDLHQAEGLEAVRRCLDAAPVEMESSPSVLPIMGVEGEMAASKSAASVSPHRETVQFPVPGGTFEVNREGVFFLPATGNEPRREHVCSPLYVTAKTRDTAGCEWGRLLEWQDDDGRLHRWAMPMEMLHGDRNDVRRELARRGVSLAINNGARDRLAAFLNLYPVAQRARCVAQLGWHEKVYLTPTGCIGDSDERVVFQNAYAIEPVMAASGTVDQWREQVAVRAAGNSRLVLALCAALAAPLLHLLGEESGGLHLRGGSSTGKTTALKVAASVWGHPTGYLRQWRATANGLEGLAAVHNDGFLTLDEIGQIDPKFAGEAAYLLANGRGKARASQSGIAKASARWRLLFLSSGEVSLGTMMTVAGGKAQAGQEVRIADLDADAGAGMGVFEQIHGCESPAAFAQALGAAIGQSHGAVGVAWLQRVVALQAEIPQQAATSIEGFVAGLSGGLSAQATRVARRFGLLAFAGELATREGLTGWREGEAMEALKRCFRTWLDGFGGDKNREEQRLLAQVRQFIEAHGASRFEDIRAKDEPRIYNRAGFFRMTGADEREYLVLPEVYKKEVCEGFDPRWATKVLVEQEWLIPQDGENTQKPRLPGLGPVRCYVLSARVLTDE